MTNLLVWINASGIVHRRVIVKIHLSISKLEILFKNYSVYWSFLSVFNFPEAPWGCLAVFAGRTFQLTFFFFVIVWLKVSYPTSERNIRFRKNLSVTEIFLCKCGFRFLTTFPFLVNCMRS